MIKRDENPEYLNAFLDYSATILNKSPNSIKEYNYDLGMFLRFIKIHFKMTSETEFNRITIDDITIEDLEDVKVEDNNGTVKKENQPVIESIRCKKI